MQLKFLAGALAAASLVVVACGGGGDNSPVFPQLLQAIAVPGVGSTTNYNFDIGTVDTAAGRYYYTDRTNKSVNVVDTHTNKLIAQYTAGFAGTGASSAVSGPDGINLVPANASQPATIYVGDVDSVKILDRGTGALIKNLIVGTTGHRADEGCFDPDDSLYMISSPNEPIPFATYINTVTQTIVAKVMFKEVSGRPSDGLEGCEYDTATKSFYVNNDGSAANPHGEVNVIAAVSIKALAAGATASYTDLQPAVKAFPLGNCDPTGLALGPNSEMGIVCRPGAVGAPLNFYVMNRNTGAIVATVAAGGGDEVTYDSATNKYYVAGYTWNPTGLSTGGCTTTAPCTPVLQVVDAASHTLATRVPTGNFGHAVSIDPATSQAFMPISSPSLPANGCQDCAATTQLSSGGVLVYRTK
jgi:hypothetical protein